VRNARSQPRKRGLWRRILRLAGPLRQAAESASHSTEKVIANKSFCEPSEVDGGISGQCPELAQAVGNFRSWDLSDPPTGAEDVRFRNRLCENPVEAMILPLNRRGK